MPFVIPKCVIVCVDYADLLQHTLPYNRHHFGDVLIVTSYNDRDTAAIASANQCGVYRTNAFYTDGAWFNKWAALEEGLDYIGRHGWMCIMDADVLWPKTIDWHVKTRQLELFNDGFQLERGKLYTPKRRMCVDTTCAPHEPYWKSYPLHPQQAEWAGYTLVFDADTMPVPTLPWFETNWRHAGGADSFFQQRWEPCDKLRPPFECLHLGDAGVNWCGRVTPTADGVKPDQAADRLFALRRFMRQRRDTGRFDAEKI